MELKVKRLGGYRYEVKRDGVVIGTVSVCRCTDRTQWYQFTTPDNQVTIKEFPSVRKAAEAGAKL